MNALISCRNGVHVPHEMTVQTLLFGDFADSWTTGSNAKIVATETQKNTVYQLARNHDLGVSLPSTACLIQNSIGYGFALACSFPRGCALFQGSYSFR